MPFPDEKVDELAETLEELDLERAMTYSLADAIREGSSVTDQCVGGWNDDEGNVCAMSAALVAIKARHLLEGP
jgi:hypothetical protein